MNPFTKYLSQWSDDGDFAAFVERWDRLERVVIGVYRDKMDHSTAAREYEQVWPWLEERYPRWEATLRPYWRATRAAGEPTYTDPFRLLLDIGAADDILDNWRAMQHLPAAREAINRYLVEHGKD